MKKAIDIIYAVKDPVLKGNLLATIPAEDHDKYFAGLRWLLLSFSWANTPQKHEYWFNVYDSIANGQILTKL